MNLTKRNKNLGKKMHELMKEIGIYETVWSDTSPIKLQWMPGTSNSLYDAMDRGNTLLKYDQIL